MVSFVGFEVCVKLWLDIVSLGPVNLSRKLTEQLESDKFAHDGGVAKRRVRSDFCC
jgi:hypothetical protein